LAAPAGHVDQHGNPGDPDESRFEQAAKDEVNEETGLIVVSLKLITEGRKENRCRREGGSWHYWRIYQAEVEGELAPSKDETKGTAWYDSYRMRALLHTGLVVPFEPALQLEQVWYEWFSEIGILNRF
jgi:8-oxo-dGTP pyrophosphatase MutT (NUDIX family)